MRHITWKLAVVGLVPSHLALFVLGVTIVSNPDAEFDVGFGEGWGHLIKNGLKAALEGERRRRATAETEVKRQAAARLDAEQQKARLERVAEQCCRLSCRSKAGRPILPKDKRSVAGASDQNRGTQPAARTRQQPAPDGATGQGRGKRPGRAGGQRASVGRSRLRGAADAGQSEAP